MTRTERPGDSRPDLVTRTCFSYSRRMGDPTLRTDLGRVLATGGSGFVGTNLVTTLLERGHHVRACDRLGSPLPDHPRHEVVHVDFCVADASAAAVDRLHTPLTPAPVLDLIVGAGYLVAL